MESNVQNALKAVLLIILLKNVFNVKQTVINAKTIIIAYNAMLLIMLIMDGVGLNSHMIRLQDA